MEQGLDGFNWETWAKENGHELDAVDRVYDELRERGLVKSWSQGRNAQITTLGVLACEEYGFVPEGVVEQQQQFRTDFLLALSRRRAEHTVTTTFDPHSIIQEIGADERMFWSMQSILKDNGMIEWAGSFVRITAIGEQRVQEYLSKLDLLTVLEELKELKGVTPQKRGHELEMLLEHAAIKEGWKVERNARAPGEENDLILSRGFDYFIVSCKWLMNPCGVEEARNLRDRVTHRPTSRGILFSMSGFASTFIDDIAARLGHAVILPFGPEDTEKTLAGQLTSLLQQKLDTAMVNRQFPWA